jgi:hypothetical protein
MKALESIPLGSGEIAKIGYERWLASRPWWARAANWLLTKTAGRLADTPENPFLIVLAGLSNAGVNSAFSRVTPTRPSIKTFSVHDLPPFDTTYYREEETSSNTDRNGLITVAEDGACRIKGLKESIELTEMVLLNTPPELLFSVEVGDSGTRACRFYRNVVRETDGALLEYSAFRYGISAASISHMVKVGSSPILVQAVVGKLKKSAAAYVGKLILEGNPTASLSHGEIVFSPFGQKPFDCGSKLTLSVSV